MFDEWAKMAAGMLAIALLIAFMIAGIESLIPLLIVGGALFMAFHAAKGFAQADQDRRQGRRKGK